MQCWNELSTTDIYKAAKENEKWDITGRTLRENGLNGVAAGELELTASDPNVIKSVDLVDGKWVITPEKGGYGTANILVKYTGSDTPEYGVLRVTVIQDTDEVHSLTAAAAPKLAAPQIQAGMTFTAALRSDGTVWTWGVNNVGQLGDGSMTEGK